MLNNFNATIIIWNLDIIYYNTENIIITPNFNIHSLSFCSLCVTHYASRWRTSQLNRYEIKCRISSNFATEIN